MADKAQTGAPAAAERKHKATYARDKRKGGYLVRVAGPYPEMFAGREVPVTTRDGAEHPEKLTALIWTGADAERGERVALYAFESRPRDTDTDVIDF
jgi:hypothetical protein